METPTAGGPKVATEANLQHAYELCLAKIRRSIRLLADAPMSGSCDPEGNFFAFPEGFFDIGNWTSSFFTGMALLGFQSANDLELLHQVNRLGGWYREKVSKQRMDTMHDLGFLYSLYSVALYKLTGNLEDRATALCAADELAKRFVPRGRFIQAWGRMDDPETEYAGLAIIDCMMNLPLLFWASAQTGNPYYSRIAIQHADTTLDTFIRPDDSVFHAYRFDPDTGAPARGDNYCGRDVDSHWARGTGWAIYGFALAFKYTGDERYLDASARVARKFISLLDEGGVPVWDFRLSADDPFLRDSSAAAVAACGLQELSRHLPDESAFAEESNRLLGRLCEEDYLDERHECPGVLKKGQVGDGIGKARHAYTSWGDYFFMEALSRKLHGSTPWW